MPRKALHMLSICTLTCVLGLTSCTPIQPSPIQPPPSPPQPSDTRPVGEPISPEEGQQILAENAQRKRDYWKDKTFDQFKATVYREPFEGGKYIVDGDTPILNDKQLEEFFETRIKGDIRHPLALSPAELTIATLNGQDIAWNSVEKRQLTYCVSPSFGNRHTAVVQAIQAATGAWEAVANVKYMYTAAQDANCTANNQQVVFDVSPVNVNGEYLARAFFPNEPRTTRNVLIDASAFNLDPSGKLTLAGILRHELGHTIGFRHEHTRPEAGTCFEDNNWRPVTNYDAFSVMHYPQCNGRGDWSLTLTRLDQHGAACIYGAAPGFTIDRVICPSGGPGPAPGPSPAPAQTASFTQQHVDRGAVKVYQAFAVSPGTLFQVKMVGEGNPGDPDIYVRFGGAPTPTRYNCRPYLSGANETCALDVPSGQRQAFVMVRGYAAGNYSLTVVYVPGP
jgi:serine protease